MGKSGDLLHSNSPRTQGELPSDPISLLIWRAEQHIPSQFNAVAALAQHINVYGSLPVANFCQFFLDAAVREQCELHRIMKSPTREWPYIGEMTRLERFIKNLHSDIAQKKSAGSDENNIRTFGYQPRSITLDARLKAYLKTDLAAIRRVSDKACEDLVDALIENFNHQSNSLKAGINWLRMNDDRLPGEEFVQAVLRPSRFVLQIRKLTSDQAFVLRSMIATAISSGKARIKKHDLSEILAKTKDKMKPQKVEELFLELRGFITAIRDQDDMDDDAHATASARAEEFVLEPRLLVEIDPWIQKAIPKISKCAVCQRALCVPRYARECTRCASLWHTHCARRWVIACEVSKSAGLAALTASSPASPSAYAAVGSASWRCKCDKGKLEPISATRLEEVLADMKNIVELDGEDVDMQTEGDGNESDD